MKAKIIGVALFVLTAGAVMSLPVRQAVVDTVPKQHGTTLQEDGRSSIDVVFVLDTTGSMGGLIAAAKEKIWSIASSMAQADPAPRIRMGLVAYRDRGDNYVTRVVDLSADLDSVYATLMEFTAQGGGDGPESVNKALHDAVERISWSEDSQGTYKVVFLVGDAPPHMDYQDEMQYPQIVELARQRDIVVNTIQAGSSRNTTREWRRIAAAGGGDYFQVGQSGSAVAIATPYDDRLAKLSRELDATRLYYGDREERALKERKVEATKKLHDSASITSRARRATFNSTASGEENLLGDKELVDDVSSGKVDLDTVAPASLPEPLQAMAPTERKQLIQEKAEIRASLQAEIRELAEKRSDYLKHKVEEEGGAEESLDDRLYGAVKAQAASKGIRYDAAAPAY